MPLSPELLKQFKEMKWMDEEQRPQKKEDKYCKYGMSPYERVSSPSQFTDIADVVNRKQFSAYYPQTYAPVSNYFVAYGYQPYFNPGSGEDFAYGALTIAGMVELCANDISFRIDRDADVYVVKEIAEQYLSTIRDIRDRQIVLYAKKVEKLILKLLQAISIIEKRTGVTRSVVPIEEILKKLIKV